jgi:hypothetical protein
VPFHGSDLPAIDRYRAILDKTDPFSGHREDCSPPAIKVSNIITAELANVFQ